MNVYRYVMKVEDGKWFAKLNVSFIFILFTYLFLGNGFEFLSSFIKLYAFCLGKCYL